MSSIEDRTFDFTRAKAFSLNFLTKPITTSIALNEWIWQPACLTSELEIKEATFCGKNKADDWKNT